MNLVLFFISCLLRFYSFPFFSILSVISSENALNGSERNTDDGPSLLDTITISGRDEHCKETAEALKALVPVTKTVSFIVLSILLFDNFDYYRHGVLTLLTII